MIDGLKALQDAITTHPSYWDALGLAYDRREEGTDHYAYYAGLLDGLLIVGSSLGITRDMVEQRLEAELG